MTPPFETRCKRMVLSSSLHIQWNKLDIYTDFRHTGNKKLKFWSIIACLMVDPWVLTGLWEDFFDHRYPTNGQSVASQVQILILKSAQIMNIIYSKLVMVSQTRSTILSTKFELNTDRAVLVSSRTKFRKNNKWLHGSRHTWLCVTWSDRKWLV